MINTEKLEKIRDQKKAARERAKLLTRRIRKLEIAAESERLQTLGKLVDEIVGKKAPIEKSKLIELLRSQLSGGDQSTLKF